MTSALQSLILHFTQYLPLNAQEKEELSKRTIIKKIKRGKYILEEGDVCRHYNFVAEGCFKMYSADSKGAEHNIQFAAENDWITDIGSFHSEKPSRLFIEAIEPSTIVQIGKKDLLFFYVNYPKFDRNFRVIIENKFIELQNRVLQNISSTAKERYVCFLKQYPELFNRIPNKQIASYLGITPEFLSNIRRDLSTQNHRS